jgi:large subunit ribosomal protein L33
MATNKSTRIVITLECIECRSACSTNKNKIRRKQSENVILNAPLGSVSHYITQKNRKNNPARLELKKYCSLCNKQTIHKEMK